MVIDKNLSYENLNILYNSADIGINTSSGEGWGLIPCEMGLCEIAQIIPRNTSYPEIFGDDYDFIKTFEISHKDGRNNIRADGTSDPIFNVNPNTVVVFLQSCIAINTDNQSHLFVESLEIKQGFFNILISESGVDTEIPNKSLDTKYGKHQIDMNFASIDFAANYVCERNIDTVQIIVQTGDNFGFLLKNVLKHPILDGCNRATRQIKIDNIYGTYDQHNIILDIPIIDDTVRLLNKYYSDRKQCIEVGKNIRKRLIERFHPTTVMQKLEEIFAKYVRIKI